MLPKTIPNRMPEIHITITLTTPYSNACPYSGYPLEGSTITVEYTPKDVILELSAIKEYLEHFSKGEATDVETVAQQTAIDCAKSLNVPVTIHARYLLRDGIVITCECQS